jgi:hypothetical protein
MRRPPPALEPLYRKPFRIRSWGDVFFLYLASSLILLPFALVPVYRIELHVSTGSGSVDYESSASLCCRHSSVSSVGGEQPQTEDAVEAEEASNELGDIEHKDADLSFAAAATLIIFSIPRTRWSRGLRVLAVLSWLTAILELRSSVPPSLAAFSQSLRDHVQVEWRWGFWVLVGTGVALAAWTIVTFRGLPSAKVSPRSEFTAS